jgi:CHAD domain-containing protein
VVPLPAELGILPSTMKEPLRALLEDVSRAERKARRRGGAEDWHRLRTTSRHLRGALIAHADGLDDRQQARAVREARRITRLPARVRDLDVAIENLEALRAQARSDDEREAARRAVRRLERKRKAAARKARHRLRRDRPVARLKRRLGKLSDASAPSGPPRRGLEACAEEVLRRRAELAGWDQAREVHRLRVAVKKYRSALMAISPHHPALDGLQRVQQVLGEHHDWSELADRLAGKKRVGYQALAARARQEQRIRYEQYQHHLDERLPRLVAPPRGNLELVG